MIFSSLNKKQEKKETWFDKENHVDFSPNMKKFPRVNNNDNYHYRNNQNEFSCCYYFIIIIIFKVFSFARALERGTWQAEREIPNQKWNIIKIERSNRVWWTCSLLHSNIYKRRPHNKIYFYLTAFLKFCFLVEHHGFGPRRVWGGGEGEEGGERERERISKKILK